MTSFTQLSNKEVICVRDGRRLGFVSDLRLGLPQGQVCSLVVPGPCRFFGLFGRSDDYVIPWDAIRRIGPDIVLVDIIPEDCRVRRAKTLFPL